MSIPDYSPPLPAPLPSSSAAGRGEIPARDQTPPTPAPEDPDGPRMAEDERTLWLCLSIVAAFVALMVVVSAMGGL